MTHKNKLILFFIALFVLAGCVNLKKEAPVKQYFDLTAPRPLAVKISPGTSLASQGEPILVKELLIAPAFDSHAFVYQLGPSSYQADFYSEFISYPARLITEKITEALSWSGYFSLPLRTEKQAITFRLSGKITHLYGDLKNLNQPKAVMGIRLILEKKKEKTFVPVFNQTYRFDEPTASASPSDLITGWNTGLSKIIDHFLKDFQTLN